MFIRDIYGRGLTKPAIGLELELESSKRQDLTWMEQKNTMWVSHADGSLRQNGVEYVFAQPYFGGDIAAALAQFEDNTKKVPFVQSLNGSVHVHYNVGHLLVTEVMNIVTAWAILEDAFLSLCHPSRNGNLFTLRFSDANNLTQVLQSGIRDRGITGMFAGFSVDGWKYLNLNLAAIRQFGTIEFRCYHSTHNTEEIQSWINRLINFCGLAIKFKSPVHLLEEAERDIHSFASDLAGVRLTDELLDRVRRNISTAFRLAFVTTEWEDIDAIRKSPPPKPAKEPVSRKKLLNEYVEEARLNMGLDPTHMYTPNTTSPRPRNMTRATIIPDTIRFNENPIGGRIDIMDDTPTSPEGIFYDPNE